MSRRRAFTILEMIFFGAIASAILIAIVGLLARGTKLFELVRRTSGTQVDLRSVLETLSEDAAEIVQFEGTGAMVDVASTLTFDIRSSRAERGIPAGKTSVRKISYQLTGADKLKDVVRTVTDTGGSATSETIVRAGVASFKVWPVAAIPKPPAFVLAPGDAPAAHQAGATPACLVVEISAGQEVAGGTVQLDRESLSTIVTKLWCRNRVLELARGALK